MVTTAPAPGRHRTSRPPRRLPGVLLGLVAVLAVAGAVAVFVLRAGFAPVLSPSMEPGFAPGDLLITRQVDARSVDVGDVVVLPRPDAPAERYAHRVVEVDRSQAEPRVRTKGDNNAAADPQRLRITSPTVPVVAGHVPWIGRVALLGQYGGVRVAVIVFAGLCLLVAAKRALW
ncbi:signal peptidase I [Amycolatopsis sp. FBCC-B4732]|uniref:signal peptidase I n=1 Tax=Amycolatopsis sp. FBCC-B4732 TaxID=3079339 RepID=UPI001FF6930D|nr:signal peptidase I [Amycolatopsis sp. FBCC-B4732]UOX85210.1 signal peptidase I [Amycolatopsis sp. FBCC-B4732]